MQTSAEHSFSWRRGVDLSRAAQLYLLLRRMQRFPPNDAQVLKALQALDLSANSSVQRVEDELSALASDDSPDAQRLHEKWLQDKQQLSAMPLARASVALLPDSVTIQGQTQDVQNLDLQIAGDLLIYKNGPASGTDMTISFPNLTNVAGSIFIMGNQTNDGKSLTIDLPLLENCGGTVLIGNDGNVMVPDNMSAPNVASGAGSTMTVSMPLLNMVDGDLRVGAFQNGANGGNICSDGANQSFFIGTAAASANAGLHVGGRVQVGAFYGAANESNTYGNATFRPLANQTIEFGHLKHVVDVQIGAFGGISESDKDFDTVSNNNVANFCAEKNVQQTITIGDVDTISGSVQIGAVGGTGSGNTASSGGWGNLSQNGANQTIIMGEVGTIEKNVQIGAIGGGGSGDTASNTGFGNVSVVNFASQVITILKIKILRGSLQIGAVRGSGTGNTATDIGRGNIVAEAVQTITVATLDSVHKNVEIGAVRGSGTGVVASNDGFANLSSSATQNINSNIVQTIEGSLLVGADVDLSVGNQARSSGVSNMTVSVPYVCNDVTVSRNGQASTDDAFDVNLGQLKAIGGEFSFNDNLDLFTLDNVDLSNLKCIGKNLSVENNPQTSNVDALQQVECLGWCNADQKGVVTANNNNPALINNLCGFHLLSKQENVTFEGDNVPVAPFSVPKCANFEKKPKPAVTFDTFPANVTLNCGEYNPASTVNTNGNATIDPDNCLTSVNYNDTVVSRYACGGDGAAVREVKREWIGQLKACNQKVQRAQKIFVKRCDCCCMCSQ